MTEDLFEVPDILTCLAEPFPNRHLTLKPGGGAYEFERPASHYGPRP